MLLGENNTFISPTRKLLYVFVHIPFKFLSVVLKWHDCSSFPTAYICGSIITVFFLNSLNFPSAFTCARLFVDVQYLFW